jgi:hypothetical protein
MVRAAKGDVAFVHGLARIGAVGRPTWNRDVRL